MMLIAVSILSLFAVTSGFLERPPCNPKPFNNLAPIDNEVHYNIEDDVAICKGQGSSKGLTYEGLRELYSSLAITVEEYEHATGLPYRAPPENCPGADKDGLRKRIDCTGTDEDGLRKKEDCQGTDEDELRMREYCRGTNEDGREECSGTDEDRRRKGENYAGVDDGNMCCSTKLYFTKTTREVKDNVYGEPCQIIPNQFYTIGECGTRGTCSGQCHLRNTIHWFHAYNLVRNCVGHTPFYVNTYCICQNTSS